MNEVQITSEFVFDVWLERWFGDRFSGTTRLTHIKITCPPSYYTAKMIVDEIIKDILKDNDEIPTREDEVVKIYARLGAFR